MRTNTDTAVKGWRNTTTMGPIDGAASTHGGVDRREPTDSFSAVGFDPRSEGMTENVADFSYAATATDFNTADMRSAFRRWCAERGGQEDQWPMILTELAYNAIGACPPTELIRVTVVPDGDSLIGTVRDRGQGFELDGDVSMPDAHSTRGRGLAIVKALTDTFDVTRSGDETIVTVSLANAETEAEASSERQQLRET